MGESVPPWIVRIRKRFQKWNRKWIHREILQLLQEPRRLLRPGDHGGAGRVRHCHW